MLSKLSEKVFGLLSRLYEANHGTRDSIVWKHKRRIAGLRKHCQKKQAETGNSVMSDRFLAALENKGIGYLLESLLQVGEIFDHRRDFKWSWQFEFQKEKPDRLIHFAFPAFKAVET